jgi:hypothetical protein
MNKVWVVTRGCYSDYGIAAIFSTKEKAWEYYNMKRVIDDEYNEPDEWDIDEAKPDEYVEAYKYNDDSGWSFCEWEDYMEECITKHEINICETCIKVSFNQDKNIMRKAADDRLAFLKAQEEGIA